MAILHQRQMSAARGDRLECGAFVRVAVQPQAACPGLEDRLADHTGRRLPLFEEALACERDAVGTRLKEGRGR